MNRNNMRKTNWQKYALGDILNAVSRPVDVEIDRSYRILGMRWYTQGLFEKESLFGHEIKANKLFRVEEGDLVYNRLFAWKGSFGLVDSKTAGAFVSGEFPCFRVNSEIAEPKFLVWFLSRESLWKDIERKSVGQTNISRLRLKVPVFLSFRIPLPPLDEQRRIANRLDAIATRVEQAQQLQINILDNITKLIVSLHVNMAKNREVTLSEILELYEDQEPINPAHEYPQVGIRGFGKGIFYRETLSGSDTTYKHFNHLYNDAILLSQVKGWEGAIAVCPPEFADMYASPEYRTFRCFEKAAVPAYLSALFSTPWFLNQLKDLTRGIGARRQRIKPELFLGLKILMPGYEDQERAVRIFSKLETIQSIIPENQDKVANLIPAVLERAFNGGL
jgi:type I restriction enzyme, S subunit